LKILLVADEFFAWGVYGGFGAFTRKLGEELVKRGIEVEAIVHHISDQQKPPGEYEMISGVRVTTLPRKKLSKIISGELYKTDADIIHSQSGMFDTYLAFKINKESKKIITFQDPRTKEEISFTMQYEAFKGYPWYKAIWGKYVDYLYSKAVKMADLIACQAKYKIHLVKKMYNLMKEPIWLPNMVDVPTSPSIKKSDTPMCIFLGRLDPIKRPEIFCELAKYFPQVDFYLLGKSHFPGRDEALRSRFKNANIHFMGFDSGELKKELLRKAWILINTSIYECLPVSFLEACAYKCAILSTQNPDDFAKNFGCWANDVESLRKSLEFLLENDRWREFGEKGYNYVRTFHATEKVISAHINVYKQLLGETNENFVSVPEIQI
jgi:glycosyltransferase involved in cell wall biosynthesis